MREIDAILLASRPEPDPLWVDALEARLFPAPARRRERRWHFSLALAGGLAAVALAVGFVRDAGPVDADDPCRYESVTRVERVPFAEYDAVGRPVITYRERSVTRRVRQCAPPRGADAPARAR